MDKSEPDFFKEVLSYWLTALPFIGAILIWFYFWRQRVLRKMLVERRESTMTNCSNCSNANATIHSFPGENEGGFDKPPDYRSYKAYPIAHSAGKRGAVILNVEALLVPPPSYQEAIQLGLKLKEKVRPPPPPPPPSSSSKKGGKLDEKKKGDGL